MAHTERRAAQPGAVMASSSTAEMAVSVPVPGPEIEPSSAGSTSEQGRRPAARTSSSSVSARGNDGPALKRRKRDVYKLISRMSEADAQALFDREHMRSKTRNFNLSANSTYFVCRFEDRTGCNLKMKTVPVHSKPGFLDVYSTEGSHNHNEEFVKRGLPKPVKDFLQEQLTQDPALKPKHLLDLVRSFIQARNASEEEQDKINDDAVSLERIRYFKSVWRGHFAPTRAAAAAELLQNLVATRQFNQADGDIHRVFAMGCSDNDAVVHDATPMPNEQAASSAAPPSAEPAAQTSSPSALLSTKHLMQQLVTPRQSAVCHAWGILCQRKMMTALPWSLLVVGVFDTAWTFQPCAIVLSEKSDSQAWVSVFNTIKSWHATHCQGDMPAVSHVFHTGSKAMRDAVSACFHPSASTISFDYLEHTIGRASPSYVKFERKSQELKDILGDLSSLRRFTVKEHAVRGIELFRAKMSEKSENHRLFLEGFEKDFMYEDEPSWMQAFRPGLVLHPRGMAQFPATLKEKVFSGAHAPTALLERFLVWLGGHSAQHIQAMQLFATFSWLDRIWAHTKEDAKTSLSDAERFLREELSALPVMAIRVSEEQRQAAVSDVEDQIKQLESQIGQLADNKNMLVAQVQQLLPNQSLSEARQRLDEALRVEEEIAAMHKRIKFLEQSKGHKQVSGTAGTMTGLASLTFVVEASSLAEADELLMPSGDWIRDHSTPIGLDALQEAARSWKEVDPALHTFDAFVEAKLQRWHHLRRSPSMETLPWICNCDRFAELGICEHSLALCLREGSIASTQDQASHHVQ